MPGVGAMLESLLKDPNLIIKRWEEIADIDCVLEVIPSSVDPANRYCKDVFLVVERNGNKRYLRCKQRVFSYTEFKEIQPEQYEGNRKKCFAALSLEAMV